MIIQKKKWYRWGQNNVQEPAWNVSNQDLCLLSLLAFGAELQWQKPVLYIMGCSATSKNLYHFQYFSPSDVTNKKKIVDITNCSLGKTHHS